MRPRLYTIPADRPFLATLAAGLLRMTGEEPLLLARAVVLLPTRRAARALREAFLAVVPENGEAGRPLLLPRLHAIGDLEADAIVPIAGADTVPPALSELRRRLLLTRLVLKWGERRGRETLLPGQAAALAATLARLLDTVATEGASFSGLADLVPADLSEHWQVVRRFLEILPQAWPQVLAAEGALDPAERRNRLLRRQAQIWRRSPPATPVVIAGLSGGMPALCELMAVVATLPAGLVILAGLDRDRDAAEWAAIEQDEAHPQHLMALLLKELGLTPSEVGDWPPAAPAVEPRRRRRLKLVAEALRPAATTDAWRQLPPQPPDVLAGLSRYDCPSAHEEAVTIALLLRRKLEIPGATAPAASRPNCSAGASPSTIRPVCRSTARRRASFCVSSLNSPKAGSPRCRCSPRSRIRSPPAAWRRRAFASCRAGSNWPFAGRARRRALPGSKRRCSRPRRRCAALSIRSKPASARYRNCSPPAASRSPGSPRRISKRPSGSPPATPKPAATGYGARPRARPRRASAIS